MSTERILAEALAAFNGWNPGIHQAIAREQAQALADAGYHLEFNLQDVKKDKPK